LGLCARYSQRTRSSTAEEAAFSAEFRPPAVATVEPVNPPNNVAERELFVAHDLLITDVTPKGHAPGDVLIRNGRIASIGPTAHVEADVPVLDGHGKVLLPSFVDAHSHLDKSMVGMPWYRWQAGRSLQEMLTDERNRVAQSSARTA
jgi:imidazolonepropionase-like amidohydrolase